MHACPDCGESLPTLGGVQIHQAFAHGPGQRSAAEGLQLGPHDAPLAISDPPLADLSQRSRSRWGPDPTLPLTALMVVALLVGGIAAVLGRSHSAPTTVASASAPAPSASADAAAAAPANALAKAREQYLQVAATSNAELDRLKRQGATDVSPADARSFFAHYAATLRSFDHGLRTVALPGGVKAYAQAVLDDDAQIEAGFDRVVRDPGCGCEVLSALQPVQAKMTADVQRLRAALGLPPSVVRGT